MSRLPEDFHFSQSALQDYVECNRRFELRYLDRLKWPAVEAEPHVQHERHLALGQQFHRLVQQLIVGVPEAALTRTIQDDQLKGWWESFLAHGQSWTRGRRYPEIELHTSLEGYMLLAKMDLLVIGDDSTLTIMDWKTGTRVPPRSALQQRLQTRIYPFVLVEAGHTIRKGQPVQPDEIRMVYWFTEAPQKPEIFTYSRAQYDADREYLGGLIRQIAAQDMFPLTPDIHKCLFCRYRSLCRRGVEAGDFTQDDQVSDFDADSWMLNTDFDQIAEVEF